MLLEKQFNFSLIQIKNKSKIKQSCEKNISIQFKSENKQFMLSLENKYKYRILKDYFNRGVQGKFQREFDKKYP